MADNQITVTLIGNDKSLGRSLGAASKQVSSLGNNFRAWGAGFRKASMVAAAATAAVVAGLYVAKKAISAAVNAYLEWGKQNIAITRLTGISGKAVAQLSTQFRMSGVDATKAQTGLALFAKKLDAARTAGGASLVPFQRLGVRLKDNEGKLRSTGDILAEVRDKLSNVKDAATRAGLAGALFGKGFKEMLPWLMKSRDEIRGYNKILAESGVEWGGRQVKSMKAYIAAQREMQLRWDLFKVYLGQKLLPVVRRVMNQIVTFLSDPKNTAAIKNTLTGIANAVSGALKWFTKLSTGWKQVVIGFAALGFASSPILLGLSAICDLLGTVADKLLATGAASKSASTSMAGFGASGAAAIGVIAAAAAALLLALKHINDETDRAFDTFNENSDSATNAGKVLKATTDIVVGGKVINKTMRDMANGTISLKKGGVILAQFGAKLRDSMKDMKEAGRTDLVARIKTLLSSIRGLEAKPVKLKMDAGQLDKAVSEARSRVQGLQSRLQVLGKMKPTPQVKAETRAAEAALAKAKAKLAELNKYVATSTVRVADEATSKAMIIHQNIASIFANPIIQRVITSKSGQSAMSSHATGGVFNTPHVALVAEAGPEAIIPLSKPKRAQQVMQQAGLAGNAAATAASAASVASAAASGINGQVKGKGKRLENAANTSGAIGTLVDFISSVGESLSALNSRTVPALAAGWQDKIKQIIDQVAKVALFTAAEINKAFPWTKGKKKTKKREAVDPKMGAKGQKVSQASEMTGPIGDLVDFISSMSDALTTLASSTVPQLTEEMKAKVQQLAAAATTMATIISAELVKAFPKAVTTGKGKKKKTTGGEALAALLAGGEMAGPLGEVIGLVSTTMDVLTAMTEVDPRLFEVPSNAFARVGSIIANMATTLSASLSSISVPDAVIAAVGRLKTLADALLSVLDVMRGVAEVDAGNFGTAGWSNMIAAAGGMVSAAQNLPGVSGAAGYSVATATAGAGVSGAGAGDTFVFEFSGPVYATSPEQAQAAASAIAAKTVAVFAKQKRTSSRSHPRKKS